MQTTIFNFNDKEVRTINKDGEPWFVAKDIADILEISKSTLSHHLSNLDDDERGSINSNTLGGNQYMTIVSESGLYYLINSSKTEQAKIFNRWVRKEVLPSIRKNGGYIANQENLSNDEIMAKGLVVANNILASKNKELEYVKKRLEYVEPVVSYAQNILNCKSLTSVTPIAKDYGMSAQEFNNILHDYGIQYKKRKQWFLYQKYANKGYVSSNTIDIKRSNGVVEVRTETKWTQQGKLFLYDFLKSKGVLPLIERSSVSLLGTNETNFEMRL